MTSPTSSPLPEHVRSSAALQDGLSWLYGTDLNQLTAFIRSGPTAGRTKLLLACSKAVAEPAPQAKPAADPAPTTSTDAASSSTTGGTSTPATSSDPSGSQPSTSAPPKPPAGPSSSSPDTTSAGRRKGIEQVAPPTFLDKGAVADANVKCKISTRQVVCCRETNDTHFTSTSSLHLCKDCYRASKQGSTPSSQTPSPPTSTPAESSSTSDAWSGWPSRHASSWSWDDSGSWDAWDWDSYNHWWSR